MDISEILSSLSEDDMKNLKSAAASLLGSKEEKTEGEKKELTPASLADAIPGLDAGLLTSVSKIGSMMNTPDKRCDFLNSLKPLLSPERSAKIDSASQMLRLMSALSSIKELKF